jgi:hypothetical protein
MTHPQCSVVLAFAFLAVACGQDELSPADVVLGETTLVVIVNPQVNELNSASVPSPGASRGGVTVSVDGGPSAVTDSIGAVVLPRVAAGKLTLRFSGSDASLAITVEQRELRELAVSLTASSAQVMAEVRYPSGGQVVEITPTRPIAEVNQALNGSDRIVLFRGGKYTGDLQLNGSNVSLFGRSPNRGIAEFWGSVTVTGNNNRIRGARVRGKLLLNGSGNAVTFSDVHGETVSDGHAGVFLNSKSTCRGAMLTGDNLTVLGNDFVLSTGCGIEEPE